MAAAARRWTPSFTVRLKFRANVLNIFLSHPSFLAFFSPPLVYSVLFRNLLYILLTLRSPVKQSLSSLEENGQGHAMSFYDLLSELDRLKLVKQINDIDLPQYNADFKRAMASMF